jgi:phosphohistidine phosphatase SixA
MRRRISRISVLAPAFALALLLAVTAGCAQRVQDEVETTLEETGSSDPDQGLVEDLRDGGRVIYVRHAATGPGGVNGVDTLGEREAQRNLSAEGREQSEAIGGAFRQLDIPVGEVLSSPYYRNTDTAEIAFGRFETSEELLGLLSVEDEEEERNRRFLRDRLSTPPEAGDNAVLVSHTSNLEEVAGVTLEEGEAAVYEPRGDGEFELRARLMPEDWEDLPGA